MRNAKISKNTWIIHIVAAVKLYSSLCAALFLFFCAALLLCCNAINFYFTKFSGLDPNKISRFNTYLIHR